MTASTPRVFAFGPFRLDANQQQLLRGGEPVPLPPKAFDLLVALVERGGQLLNKEDLIARVWPETFVEEGNLSYNISVIRKALADEDGGKRFIETVPKRGYRFVATVRAVSTGTGADTTAPVTRLAVLPFTNEGSDSETDYLSDGLAEGLIDSLARRSDLRVIARATAFTYKEKDLSLRRIGEELRAGALLTGTIHLREQTLTVQVELVDAASDTRIWGERYRRSLSDIASLHDEITTSVASALGLRSNDGNSGNESDGAQPAARHPANAEVSQLHLKGRFFLRKGTTDGITKAMDYFTRALTLDPSYAPAYAGLADGHTSLADWYSPAHEAMPRARAAATKALELDDTLTDAHLSIAIVHWAYDWDFAAAARHYTRALALSPHHVDVHHARGWYAMAMGRCEEAVAELTRAQALDPLSVTAQSSLGLAWYFARDYEKAVEQYQTSIEMEPDRFVFHYLLGMVYEQQARLDEAITELTIARRSNDAPMTAAALGHAYATAGQRDKALAVVGELDAMARRAYVSPYDVATVYAGLGDTHQIFVWLDKAYEERCGMLAAWIRVDPRFDALRAHERFDQLLARMGLST